MSLTRDAADGSPWGSSEMRVIILRCYDRGHHVYESFRCGKTRVSDRSTEPAHDLARSSDDLQFLWCDKAWHRSSIRIQGAGLRPSV